MRTRWPDPCTTDKAAGGQRRFVIVQEVDGMVHEFLRKGTAISKRHKDHAAAGLGSASGAKIVRSRYNRVLTGAPLPKFSRT